MISISLTVSFPSGCALVSKPTLFDVNNVVTSCESVSDFYEWMSNLSEWMPEECGSAMRTFVREVNKSESPSCARTRKAGEVFFIEEYNPTLGWPDLRCAYRDALVHACQDEKEESVVTAWDNRMRALIMSLDIPHDERPNYNLYRPDSPCYSDDQG